MRRRSGKHRKHVKTDTSIKKQRQRTLPLWLFLLLGTPVIVALIMGQFGGDVEEGSGLAESDSMDSTAVPSHNDNVLAPLVGLSEQAAVFCREVSAEIVPLNKLPHTTLVLSDDQATMGVGTLSSMFGRYYATNPDLLPIFNHYSSRLNEISVTLDKQAVKAFYLIRAAGVKLMQGYGLSRDPMVIKVLEFLEKFTYLSILSNLPNCAGMSARLIVKLYNQTQFRDPRISLFLQSMQGLDGVNNHAWVEVKAPGIKRMIMDPHLPEERGDCQICPGNETYQASGCDIYQPKFWSKDSNRSMVLRYPDFQKVLKKVKGTLQHWFIASLDKAVSNLKKQDSTNIPVYPIPKTLLG